MEHREHVISIVLNDEEWHAFVRLHPQPVEWLRSRIEEAIKSETAGHASASPASAHGGGSPTPETRH